MAEKRDLLNENENVNNNEELQIIIENEQEVEETFYDELSTSLTIDEIQDLSENDIVLLIEKVDIEIEKYEDIYVKGDSEGKTFEEIQKDGFDENEYNRLKALNKALYKNLKAMRKINKEDTFFASIPLWAILLCLAIALLTIYPVSPFLPTKLCTALSEIIMKFFDDYRNGATVFFILYNILFLVIEGICTLCIYKKCKKEGKGYKSVRNFAILIIVNFVLMIYPVVAFLIAVWN